MNKFVYGQNPDDGKIPMWTKSRIGQNPDVDKIPMWTKSRI